MTPPNSKLSINYFSQDTYDTTLQYLKNALPDTFQTVEIGIVCGSGLGGLVNQLTKQFVFDYHVKYFLVLCKVFPFFLFYSDLWIFIFI